jgi:hypothetical protein
MMKQFQFFKRNNFVYRHYQVIAIFAKLGKEAFEVSEYVLENNYPMHLSRKSDFKRMKFQ